MKKEGHPEYNNVVFVDVSTNREFPTRSTLKSKETKVIDGVEHFVDTAGRVEKFNTKFRRK
jgi:large subunit ribosomal protein L31